MDKKYDLIIAPYWYKKEILKYWSLNKKIVKTKIISLEEFKNNYFGTYDPKAFYYLIKKYNYKPEIVKEYLNNLFYNSLKLKKIYEELNNNNLLIFNPYFKNSFQTILIIGYSKIDNYLLKELNQYSVTYQSNNNHFKHNIYEFETIDEEICFQATQILEQLKVTPINKIFLVNVTEEYLYPLKRIFTMYNINFNIKSKQTIFTTPTVNQFLKQLKITKNIKLSLENIPKNEIYNIIIDLLNKYTFVKKVDEALIECLTYELKQINTITPTLDEAIEVISLDEMLLDDAYYFILGFNEQIPKVYRDEDYLMDKEKISLGIMSSLEKNKTEKEKIENLLLKFKNLTISYKLKTPFASYYPSPLVEQLTIIKDYKIKPFYSNMINKINLGKMLDKFIKFNDKDTNLNLYYTTYKDVDYLTYNNSFTNLDNNSFLNFIDNKLLLSYSSLNNYFKCQFKYYINNILKLDPFEDTLATKIGNLFHICLSKMYEKDFNLEEVYQAFIKTQVLNYKEQFFIEHLKQSLIFVIDTINAQDCYSDLSSVLTEQKIYVNKDRNIKITFMGIVDKIKYKEENNKTIMAIIDYKTGLVDSTLDNINYGLNLQLPLYIYLAKNSNFKEVEIAGFYLQKILNSETLDAQSDDLKTKLKLVGFTNSNLKLLNQMDTSYEDSLVIKSMKMCQNGFYHYAKVLTSQQIDNISKLVDTKIEEAIDGIITNTFTINPKRIDDKLIGCQYCQYKDLCYRKEEDIINLKNTPLEDVLGGENNA
ncbi:MAG: PD-(D/E)XK nuclease family protein [Bacilli bacterium]